MSETVSITIDLIPLSEGVLEVFFTGVERKQP
jgi:hypothetical protein